MKLYFKSNNTLDKSHGRFTSKFNGNIEDELDYYSKVGDILFEYYDEVYGGFYNNSNIYNTNDLDKFKIHISPNLQALHNSTRNDRCKKASKNNQVIIPSDESRSICLAKLEDEYLTIIDTEYKQKNQNKNILICPECGIDRCIADDNSRVICINPKCSIVEDLIDKPEINHYNVKKSPYKREAHFTEKLNQYLCNRGNIPQNVFDIITADMAKYDYSVNDISISFITKSLKRNKLSRYYDDIIYIYNKIRNVEPTTITQYEYINLIKMFRQVNTAYEEKFKPANRSNSLRYSLILFRLFQITGMNEHTRTLKLLKNIKEMQSQFRIIDKIFTYLGWDYDVNYSYFK